MKIYVETNFVQELVFLQEQSESCEKILSICEKKDATMWIPAFSLAEPLDKLHRQKNLRQEIQKNLDSEIRQLSRTSGYQTKIQSIKNLDLLFAQSIEDERKRFEYYRKRILDIALVLPLDSNVLNESENLEKSLNLSAQDAIVYVSVLSNLRTNQSEDSCFLNRNSKDFDIPDIRTELESYNCLMIPRFDDGLQFIEARV